MAIFLPGWGADHGENFKGCSPYAQCAENAESDSSGEKTGTEYPGEGQKERAPRSPSQHFPSRQERRAKPPIEIIE